MNESTDTNTNEDPILPSQALAKRFGLMSAQTIMFEG
jgi:hypothetical protein